jgi:transcriptional regulator with XRE-family HTH domain
VHGIYPRRWDSTQVVPNEPKTLGERPKKRRLELHLFQKDVAKLIGTHTATIQNWERRVYEPAERFVGQIARFLGAAYREQPLKSEKDATESVCQPKADEVAVL